MRGKIQIVVLDEQSLIRDGLCALLSLDRELEVLAAYAVSAGIARIDLPSAPDVVIGDFATTGAHGIEMITSIRSRWETVRILVLTSCREGRIIETTLRSGADGYLLKSDTRAELSAAIRTVLDGKRYVSPALFDRVISGYVKKAELARQHHSDGLSEREREVLRGIALGYRTREIAQQLSLSHKTIEKHRSSLMRKLGLRTAPAVAAYAITKGYLEE